MNLHKVLIVFAILFCWGFGVYEISLFANSGGNVSLVLGITFVILGSGMIYYLVHLDRFLGPKEK
jgi:hypothetical protein